MIPANATVTSIVTPGTIDAYGDATTGTVAWSGKVDCYLRRPRKGYSTDREADPRLDEAVLLARSAASLLATLESGESDDASRVTITDRRTGTSVTRTYELVGLDMRVGDSDADSVRLTLRREA